MLELREDKRRAVDKIIVVFEGKPEVRVTFAHKIADGAQVPLRRQRERP